MILNSYPERNPVSNAQNFRKSFDWELELSVQIEGKETVIKMTKGYVTSDFSLLPNDTI